MNRIRQFVNFVLSAVRKFVNFTFSVIRTLVIATLSAICTVNLVSLIFNDSDIVALVTFLCFWFVFMAINSIWGIIRKPNVKYYYNYMLKAGLCGTLGFFILGTCIAMDFPSVLEGLLMIVFLALDICSFIFISLGFLHDDRSAD